MDETKQQSAAGPRCAERAATEVAIVCRPYASRGSVGSAAGVLRNFSAHGAYIETVKAYTTGTILIVRLIGGLPAACAGEAGENPRSIGLAEIRWRHELDPEAPFHYGMGLRYLD